MAFSEGVLMRLRKILMLPAVVSISAIFAFGSIAQQEDSQVNDKVRELQEQYHRLLKDEYNPSTIQPKTDGKPSFSSNEGWMKSSKAKSKKKSRHRRNGSRSRAYARKKHSGKKLATGKSRKFAGRVSKKGAGKGIRNGAHTKAASGHKSKAAGVRKGAKQNSKASASKKSKSSSKKN
jgi:hypothetical protein